MKRSITAKMIGGYESLAGSALLAWAIASRSWWTAVVGAVILIKGVLTLAGTGESTSWLRGEIDERRQSAVDGSFRVAFLVLAWWVAAVTAIAATHDLPHALWSAGIILALVVAYANYALTLRRI